MADGGGVIIIRGGSCEIHYDDGLFEKVDGDPAIRAHKHDVKIKQIVITGTTKFDSGKMDDGFVGDIRITYGY